MSLNAGTVSASATLNTRGFMSGLTGMKKAGNRTTGAIQQSFRSLSDTLSRTGRILTASISAPLIGVGALAVKTAADYEKLRVSMDVLNGSAEEGARNFERLKDFSAKTPFQLQDLAQAQNMLQGFGLAADDAFDSIKMIGDIAAVSGGSIEGIGIAFGQAAAEGRLMTRDIRQLINQGVPAIKLLADTMNVAESEIFDLASEGEISFDILKQAFRDATSEGGMFANGMAKQAETIGGVFSTLKDNVSLSLGELGNTIAETLDLKQVVRNLTSSIQDITARFSGMSDEVRTSVLKIAGLFIAGGPILTALSVLVGAFAAISWPAVLGLSAISAAATAIISNWDDVVAYFTQGKGAKLWSSITDFASKAATELMLLFEEAVVTIISVWNRFGDTFIDILGGAMDIAAQLFGGVANSFSAILNIMQGDWTGFWIDMLQAAAAFLKPIQPALAASISMQAAGLEAQNYAEGMSETQKKVREEIEKTKETIRGLIDGFKEGVLGDGGGGGRARAELKGLANQFITTGAIAEKSLEGMMIKGGEFADATEAALQKVRFTWEDFKDFISSWSEEFKALVIQGIQNTVIGLGEVIGKTLSGTEDKFATTFEKVVKIVLQFAKDIAKLAAAIGAALLFVPGGQGAGAALLGASAAITAASTGIEAGIDKRITNRQNRANQSQQMEAAFDRSLQKHTQRLSPEDVYVMGKRGQHSF